MAGVGGSSGVIAGAIGAHALALDPSSQAGQTFGLAVTYLLLHSAALLAIALYRAQAPAIGLPLQVAAALFTLGIILFSGSLILATLADLPALKASAPWGGSALIAGWVAVAAAAFRRQGVDD